MYRSFRALMELHDPEIVFILGELLQFGVLKFEQFISSLKKNSRIDLYNTLISFFFSVVCLGDIFDEASFSPDEIYSNYVQTFKELFHLDKPSELYVIAGNHDIGFHYA